MSNYNKDILNLLKNNNCEFVRHGKGDHSIYFSPLTLRNFTVDSKIKSRHTANAIMRQSGINFKF
jgi:hypothetical protein